MHDHRDPEGGRIVDCTCPFPSAERPMWPRYIPGPALLARLWTRLRGRRHHEPRAIGLVLALPPARGTTPAPGQYRAGPIAMPIPGPGRPMRG